MAESRINNKHLKIFLYLVVVDTVIFQILSVLRAATIYNTGYIQNYTQIGISLFIILIFMRNLRKIKMTPVEIVLLLVPIIYFLFGVMINGLNRDLFADTYTSASFIIIYIVFRNSRYILDEQTQLRIANIMFWGLLISTIIYTVFPLIGFRIFSVGRTSIQFILPLLTFLIFKKRGKFSLHLILLVLASKRGVLLAAGATIFIFGLMNKKIKRTVRFGVVSLVLLLAFSITFITLEPTRIYKMPVQTQRMLMKTMYVNPLSEYNQLESDARIREIKYAMKPLIEKPIILLTGNGPGYTYEFYSSSGELDDDSRHNVHFSPVTIYTRYGLFYFIVFYWLISSTLVKSLLKMKRKKVIPEYEMLILYVFASFINSFTAFTLYNEYIFIIFVAILSRKTFNGGDHADSHSCMKQ